MKQSEARYRGKESAMTAKGERIGKKLKNLSMVTETKCGVFRTYLREKSQHMWLSGTQSRAIFAE